MQRSGSQKALLVISIISIVFSVFALLGGVMMMFGGALVGSINASEAATALQGSGMTQGQLSAFAGIAGLVIIFSGAIQLILGILGVRAANDNQKIMPVWVFAIIELVLSAISLVSTFMNGTFSTQGASTVFSLILAVAIMWIANNIKREAGK